MALKQSKQLKYFARVGAQTRLLELQREIADIYRSFPDLANQKARADGKTTYVAPQATRRPPRWSAAARQAVSTRMKKYWAMRRRQKKTEEST